MGNLMARLMGTSTQGSEAAPGRPRCLAWQLCQGIPLFLLLWARLQCLRISLPSLRRVVAPDIWCPVYVPSPRSSGAMAASRLGRPMWMHRAGAQIFRISRVPRQSPHAHAPGLLLFSFTMLYWSVQQSTDMLARAVTRESFLCNCSRDHSTRLLRIRSQLGAHRCNQLLAGIPVKDRPITTGAINRPQEFIPEPVLYHQVLYNMHGLVNMLRHCIASAYLHWDAKPRSICSKRLFREPVHDLRG